MAAEAKTETTFNIVGEVPVEASVTIATQNDWVVLPCAGAQHIVGTNFYDGGMEATAVSHPTITASADALATATEVTYDGATANQRTSGKYLIVNDATGELIEVLSDSGYDGTSGTITMRRGVMGTTAGAITDNDVFYVLNALIFTSSNVGTHFFRYYQMQPTAKPYE